MGSKQKGNKQKQKVATAQEEVVQNVAVAIKGQPKLKETPNKKVKVLELPDTFSRTFKVTISSVVEQDKKKNQKPVAPPVPVKQAESSEESDSEDEPTKPVAVSKVAIANGKGKVNVAAKKAESSEDESDSDDSETEPPSKTNGKAPANGSTAKKPANGTTKKAAANDESEDESDSGKQIGIIFVTT